jgi:flavorubredoxin/flavin reductase (DIM6/NTAB) family NADH-FMN oxidoreductase RutF/rubredoxin
MFNKRLVTKDTYYVGASDRRLALFENIYPLTNGVSYNSYIIMDKKIAIMDTVDSSIGATFFKKINDTLNGRTPDYLVIDHMEPDHSATISQTLEKYPNITIVCNDKILTMLNNYFEKLNLKNVKVVKEFDVLDLGEHKLTFIFAPMVHWPEVMMTYDTTTKTLFSADAFGTFGALSGNLFAHEVDFDHDYLDEARRYYTNIVGKYGQQVQAVLKKAATIEIETICPLHGPIWRQDIPYILDKYDKWSAYEPEKKGVLVCYASVYGHTEEAANLVCDELAMEGIRDIHCYDVSKTDKSYLVAEAFKYSHIFILSTTYNMQIFTKMEEFLMDLKYHNLQNRTVAVIENGSWAPQSGTLIKNIFATMPGIKIIPSTLTIKSALKENQMDDLRKIISEMARDFPKAVLNTNPLFKINYGLYVLVTKDDNKANGCIVNTVSQVCTDKVLISVNKANYSAELFKKNKIANICVLTNHCTFDIFKRFGYQSGKTVDKFLGFTNYRLAKNGLPYISKYSNSYMSVECVEEFDLGSHIGFLCKVVGGEQLSNEDSVTYAYYLDNIKPKPARDEKKIVGWRCKICGYIYEGKDLPKDFVCPICKHPASDFEKIGW